MRQQCPPPSLAQAPDPGTGTDTGPTVSTSVGASEDSVPNLTTPQVARDFFDDLGITQERVEKFANGLGLSASEYYQAVANAFSDTEEKVPPVEFTDGKVVYNNTVVNSLSFTRTQRRSQAGSTATGRCTFPSLSADSSLGDNLVSEVIELDPERCTRVIFDGAYDPAQTSGPSKALSGPQFLPCNSLTKAPTLYQPPYDWVDGENRRYYKQSFVDPVCIAITSTTLNARWKNAFNSGTDVTLLSGTKANPYYFTSLGENWPNNQKSLDQFPGTNDTVTQTSEVSAYLGHIRVETDFPEHLALAAAAAGSGPLLLALIACNLDLSDTTFVSNQQLVLRRNGGWGAFGFGDVVGGCSSLVHERVWHGAGAFAR